MRTHTCVHTDMKSEDQEKTVDYFPAQANRLSYCSDNVRNVSITHNCYCRTSAAMRDVTVFEHVQTAQ